MMSKKTYEKTAAILSAHNASPQLRTAIASMFAEDNPAFSHSRFMAASMPEPDESTDNCVSCEESDILRADREQDIADDIAAHECCHGSSCR